MPDDKTQAARIAAAGRRASAEAETRRDKGRQIGSAPRTPPPETGGRDGPEPTRFGDWEKKGIASDF